MPSLLTATEAAREIGISPVWLRLLCQQGRVAGAKKFGKVWTIPSPVRVLQGPPLGRPSRGEGI